MEGKRIDHYKVLEKIGEGGMGVVYRARDTRLGRDVALKFLSVDFTGSEELKERFVQEAQAASKLDHQNICTIHAIEETDDGRLFIAMGYYPGETIKAKLAGQQPLPEKDIVKIAAQIAGGLQAAHAKKIIHLDVKPANLMVTPKPSQEVKILDFGLSRFTSEIDRTRPQGPLMGTVAYMAPEQVQGESTGPETDIWALGVVMYEMATGTRPFQGKNDMAVLYSIVHRECPAPKELVPELSSEIDQVIRRALAKDRRRRYADTQELLADLEPLLQNSSTLTDTLPGIPSDFIRRQKRFQLVTAALALVALLVVSFLLWRQVEKPPPEPVDVVLTQLHHPQSDDAAWRAEALSELLVLNLNSERLRWIRRGDPDSESILHDLDLGRRSEQGFQDSTLLQLRDRGVEWILSGTLETVEQDGEELFEARLLVQSQGRPTKVLARSGTPGELIGLASELAGELAAFFGVEIPVRLPGNVSWPENAEAVGLLAQAKEKLLVYEAKTSEELLRKALTIEPGNAVLHIFLADALWQLGSEAEAWKEATTAAENARQLAPALRIYMRVLELETAYRTERAAHLLRLLWNEGLPEEGPIKAFDVAYHLVRLLLRTFQVDAALAAFESFRATQPDPDHPAILVLEGMVVSRRSHQEAQRIFARAGELAHQAQMPLLQAQALLWEGQQWERLGVVAKAEESLEVALEIFSLEGYDYGKARALYLLGNLRWAQEDLLVAQDLWADAEQLYESIGAYRYQARTFVNEGRSLLDRGDFRAGIQAQERARQIYFEQQFYDPTAVHVLLVNLGDNLIVTGAFDDAQESLDEALRLAKESDRRSRQEGSVLAALGWLKILKGNLVAADQDLIRAIDLLEDQESLASVNNDRSLLLRLRADLEQAAAVCEQALKWVEEKKGTTYARGLTARGQLRMIRAELAPAESDFREALTDLDKLLNPLWATQTRISLASLLIETGRAEEAERQAREAVAEISQSPVALDVSAAYVVLARSLLAQGDVTAAAEAVGLARQHLGTIDSPLYRIPLEIAEARIGAAQGDWNGSVAKLETLLGEESWDLAKALELEIRLAIGEIELQSGRGRSRQLESVAQEAAQKGFELIRRKADQASSAN